MSHPVIIGRIWFGLICAVGLLGWPAWSQDNDAITADPDIVQTCLAGTPTHAGLVDCAGLAAGNCERRLDSASTVDTMRCIRSEVDLWDAHLNAQYQITRSVLRDHDAEYGGELSREDSLVKAQRAWIAFREAQCALDYARFQDGTIRGPMHGWCFLDFNARRTVELRDMRAPLVP